MGVPKRATDKGEQQHRGWRYCYGTAEEYEMHDQKPRVAETGESGHELLHQKGEYQDGYGAEVVTEQWFFC